MTLMEAARRLLILSFEGDDSFSHRGLIGVEIPPQEEISVVSEDVF